MKICFNLLQNSIFSIFYKRIGIQMKTWPMSQNMTFRGPESNKEKKIIVFLKLPCTDQNYQNMTTFHLLIDKQ